jgi:hypothetical protein
MAKQQPVPYAHADFTRMLLTEFPELRSELEEEGGLLHLEMAVFSRHTQSAIDHADWPTLKRCVHVAHELWQRPDPALLNALNVSYFEHLDFDSPNGQAAWSCFTHELQTGWREMQEYLERMGREWEAQGGFPPVA